MRSMIFCFLLVITIKTSAQVDIICPKLVDSTLNYFYTGIDNPVKVIGIKMTPAYRIAIADGMTLFSKEGLTVFSEKGSTYTPGTPIFTGENRYMVRTYTPSDSCWIRIYKGKKEIFSKRFISKTLPDPDVAIANKTGMFGKTISLDTLLAYPFLSAPCPGCYLKECYQVISFMSTMSSKEGEDIYEWQVTGNYLTTEQIQYIKRLGTGSFITFEDIRSICPDGRIRKLTPLWIKIEE